MKKNFGIVLAVALGLSALLLTIAFQAGWVRANPFNQERAGAPTIVSYQGQIWDGADPFNGTGYFKFAILDATGTTYYWSNDGGELGIPPEEYIALPVVNGLFTVYLGDNSLYGSMTALSADVFDDPDTRLRVWFSPDTVTFTQLPDQKIAAVPYALQAQHAIYADDADKLDSRHGSAYQLRVSAICPENYAFKEIDASGGGVCVPVEHRPPYSLTTVDDSGDDSFQPSIAIGVDGLPLISFFRGSDSTHGGLFVMHCRTLDCTAYDINKIDTTTSGYVGTMSSIVIGQDGLGLIAYADGENNRLMVAHCADVPCTYADKIYPVVSLTSGYSLLSISAAIGVDGNPLISLIYFRLTGNDLLYAVHCNDMYCSSVTSLLLYAADSLASETSLTIGADGLGLISFHDDTLGHLRTAHCSNVACSAMTGMAIDTTADVGVDNSITIGTDGLGLIAYYCETAGALKVAHCTDIACTTATSTIIDDDGANIMGNWPDITIGSDGLGFIVYDAVKGTDQILKMAHCSNVTCSSAVTYVIDNLGKTTYAGVASVTIGTDGMPIIAYYDGNTTDLKVMHCSNNYCLPYVRSH
jgi:hypothetical protein